VRSVELEDPSVDRSRALPAAARQVPLGAQTSANTWRAQQLWPSLCASLTSGWSRRRRSLKES